MQRVLAHVDAHPDAPLDALTLAAIAALSPFHFQRLFTALYRMPVGRYVQLRRLQRAAHALAYRRDSITTIALAHGYATPDAFGRAFRHLLGQSPGAFRRAPDPARWRDAFVALDAFPHDANPGPTMRDAAPPHTVDIVHQPDIAVAMLEHRGDPRHLDGSLRRFIAWRRAHRLPPSRSRTFNLFHTADDVAPDDYRMRLCAATTEAVAPNPEGVVAGVIPGGRVAQLHGRGSDAAMAAAFAWLYGHWLPASGETLRDAPPLLERLRLFPDVAAGDAEWIACLPLAD